MQTFNLDSIYANIGLVLEHKSLQDKQKPWV